MGVRFHGWLSDSMTWEAVNMWGLGWGAWGWAEALLTGMETSEGDKWELSSQR